MATAILIDGAYFIKRFRAIEPHNLYNAERAADCVFRWAVAHLSHKPQQPVTPILCPLPSWPAEKVLTLFLTPCGDAFLLA